MNNSQMNKKDINNMIINYDSGHDENMEINN